MAIATQICDDLVTWLTTDDTVQAKLQTAADGQTLTIQRKVYISEDCSDINGLEILVTPGGMEAGKRLRVSTEYGFSVGVIVRAPLDMAEMEDSVATLGAFADVLFVQLHGYKPAAVDGLRGLELRGISTQSLYSVTSLEEYTIYDALIMLDFGYWR